MTLEHVAIWTDRIETLREFYIKHFGAVANGKYVNEVKGFQSYFLRFASGARLEIMSRPDIPASQNDHLRQFRGIIHLAFGADTMREVDEKAEELKAAGYPILSGPRRTGDGYYEFETLDPDNNRLEVTAVYPGNE